MNQNAAVKADATATAMTVVEISKRVEEANQQRTSESGIETSASSNDITRHKEEEHVLTRPEQSAAPHSEGNDIECTVDELVGVDQSKDDESDDDLPPSRGTIGTRFVV